MKTMGKGPAPAGGGQTGGAGKGAGYMDIEVMGCQFSIYPLRQDDVGPAIRDAIAAVHVEGCAARVANLSTLIWGSEDQVFRALRAAYRAAQRHGPAVMTATFAAGMPTDGLVAEIQRDVAGAGTAVPEPVTGGPARG
jgi:uncharacterized protein YqgV (UPF0045/DUF77 family)